MNLIPVLNRAGNVVAYLREEVPTPQKRTYTPRAKKISPQRQLQGKYLASIRALSKADRSKASSVFKEKGVRAAIKFAKTTAKAS